VRKLQEIGRLFTKVKTNAINYGETGGGDCRDALEATSEEWAGLSLSYRFRPIPGFRRKLKEIRK
jgi:hypothetical protein